MTTNLEERARECRYKLSRHDGWHFCHLPIGHEGEHEWFYTREQVVQIQAEARLEEAKWWANNPSPLCDAEKNCCECDLKRERIRAVAQAAAPAKETKVVPTIEEMSGLLSKDCAEQIKKDINK